MYMQSLTSTTITTITTYELFTEAKGDGCACSRHFPSYPSMIRRSHATPRDACTRDVKLRNTVCLACLDRPFFARYRRDSGPIQLDESCPFVDNWRRGGQSVPGTGDAFHVWHETLAAACKLLVSSNTRLSKSCYQRQKSDGLRGSLSIRAFGLICMCCFALDISKL